MQAKATLLTLVDTEFGYLGLAQVAKKGDDAFAIRYLASFLDRMRCDEVRLRYDNENSMVQLAEKVRAFRSPRKTTLEPIVRAEHEMVGAVERAHRTLQASVRALVFDYRARTTSTLLPGDVLFSWLVRHAAWCLRRFQP